MDALYRNSAWNYLKLVGRKVCHHVCCLYRCMYIVCSKHVSKHILHNVLGFVWPMPKDVTLIERSNRTCLSTITKLLESHSTLTLSVHKKKDTIFVCDCTVNKYPTEETSHRVSLTTKLLLLSSNN